MTAKQRKAARKASTADIVKRFPKGGVDPLGRSITLGNKYSPIGSLSFSSIAKVKK